MSNTFTTSSMKSLLVETKSVTSTFFISVGNPSCTSTAGVAGNFGRIVGGPSQRLWLMLLG